MRNNPPRPCGDALELDRREEPRGPVLGRRECETYAVECVALAEQCESAELRHLLLRAAGSWRWLASLSPP